MYVAGLLKLEQTTESSARTSWRPKSLRDGRRCSHIDALTERIEEAMEPFRAAREFLATIPGVSLKVAE